MICCYCTVIISEFPMKKELLQQLSRCLPGTEVVSKIILGTDKKPINIQIYITVKH